MTQAYCGQCEKYHNPADCPWKPAVSGVDLGVPKSNTGNSFGVAVNMQANPWDHQVGGQHYKEGIQPFEYAMANNLNSLEFSVVKYLRKKGDKAKRIEDLKKAKDCLEKLIWWEEHDGKI